MIYRLKHHTRKYKEVRKFNTHFSTILEKQGNKKYAIINNFGEIISDFEFDNVLTNNNTYYYKKNSMYGLLNKYGNKLTNNIYYSVNTFKNINYVIVSELMKYSILNCNTSVEYYSSMYYLDLLPIIKKLKDKQNRVDKLKQLNIC